MVASTMSPRSIAVATPSAGLSRAFDTFVGSLLELVIHSVEELRERITRSSPR